MIYSRWWKYAVIRGEGIPADLDGQWYDMDDMNQGDALDSFVLTPTNRWEQREDGEVAVVYEWVRKP